MALRLRRGTDLQRIGVVFEEGELVYSTDTKRLFVGDGVTAGGIPVSDLITDQSPQLGASLDLNTYDIVGFGNINIDGDITATGTLTIPNIVTDVTGSIFGDDSTPLVDGANNQLVLENNKLSDLGDVAVPDQDKQYLEWDSSTNTWTPKKLSLDYYIPNPSTDSYLKYNGTGWVTSFLNENIISQNNTILVNTETEVLYLGENNLNDLADVFLPGIINDGSILKYNSITETWEADSSGLVGNLSDLSDVSNNLPVLGDTLTWNGVEWNFTQPEEITNVVGSVFGDDSTILVDGIQNKINLSNNNLRDLADVEFYGELALGDILRWNGIRWQPTNNISDFSGDLKGSVFGDDSTVIINAIDRSITTSLIKMDFDNSLVVKALPEAEFPKIDLESYGIGSYHVTRNSDTIVDPAGELFIAQYGSWINDPNGLQLKSLILTTEKSIFLFGGAPDPQTGLHSESYVLSIKEGKFGLGTFDPVETLHTEGSISATEYIKFGSYDNTARNALSTANPTAYGMVIYNTDSNVFEGYQNTSGTTPEWVALS